MSQRLDNWTSQRGVLTRTCSESLPKLEECLKESTLGAIKGVDPRVQAIRDQWLEGRSRGGQCQLKLGDMQKSVYVQTASDPLYERLQQQEREILRLQLESHSLKILNASLSRVQEKPLENKEVQCTDIGFTCWSAFAFRTLQWQERRERQLFAYVANGHFTTVQMQFQLEAKKIVANQRIADTLEIEMHYVQLLKAKKEEIQSLQRALAIKNSQLSESESARAQNLVQLRESEKERERNQGFERECRDWRQWFYSIPTAQYAI